MSLKLLVIEDEIQMLDSFKQFFETIGYAVFTAQRAEDALKMIEDKRPHIVICDLQLDGSKTTGIEILKQTYEKYPDTKVIVVTGYAEDADIKRICEPYKPYKFLGKPISLFNLRKIIDEIVKKLETN